MQPPEKILVYVYEDLLGDSILKLPFVYALRQCFPKAHITWCAGGGKSAYSSSLFPLIEHQLDKIVEIPVGRSWREITKASPFKDEVFDLIVDTQRNLKTTLALKKIPHRIFLSRTAKFLFSDFKPYQHQKPPSHLSKQLIYLLELMLEKKIISSRPVVAVLDELKREVGKYFPPGNSYIGCAPGAGNRKKCWPLDRFVEVARFIEKVEKIPVFILGPAEQEWYSELRASFPRALFPLQENPHFLANPLYTAAIGFFLKAVVVNDSGVAHLLSLSDTKMISLFGPTKADKLYPLAEKLFLVKASDFGGKKMEDIPSQFIINTLKNI